MRGNNSANLASLTRWFLPVATLASVVFSPSYGMGTLRPVYPPTVYRNSSSDTETRVAEVGTTIYLGVGVLGDLPMTYQWYKNGAPLRGASGTVTKTSDGALGGPPSGGTTLTLANVQLADAGEYQAVLENKWGKGTSSRIMLSVVPPEPAVIVTQPAGRQAYVGDSVTLNVEAKGSVLRYQWEKDGVAIPAATNARYTNSPAAVAQSGTYTAVVRGGGVEVRSEPVQVTITVPVRPAFSAHPVSQHVATGSAMVFRATVTDASSCQWQKNGAIVPGATSTNLVIYDVSTSSAGRYTLVATNRAGSTTSSEAVLTVAPISTDAGRLTNISVLTTVGPEETLTLGTVLNNAFGTGSRPLLVRAVGPSLAPLGISGYMRDPTMTLRAADAGAAIAANNDWAGMSSLRSAFQTVGAFPYVDGTAKDAAIYQPALPVGNYLIGIKDAAAAGGRVLAELYDAGSASVSEVSPKLLNVSVRKHISGENPLVTGFSVGGTAAITVLIRAVGPTLAADPFGLAGAMPDPMLTLFDRAGKVIAVNDNWGGESSIATAATRSGAFSLAGPGSKDAVVLVTLTPGNYTAQVGPVDGTADGIALIEIYELR